MKRIHHIGGLCLSALLVSNCTTVGLDYLRPDTNDITPPGWRDARISAGLDATSPTEMADWWQTLNDPVLNQLVDEAVRSNLDIQAASARVRQARAQRGSANADRFPTITSDGSYTQSSSSENTGGTGATSDLFTVGVDASWEIDIFGGTKRSIEAATADLEAQNEARADVLVSVIAEVALNYVEVRSFQSRLAIAQENLSAQTETYDLVTSRFKSGFTTSLDVDQAATNVQSTRAEIPTLETSLQEAKNRLTTLLGTTPGALDTTLEATKPLPAIPLSLAVGVPADIMRQRPDIRQAERQLAAETARVGEQTAELYPKFSLVGSIGLESLQSGNLFAAASSTFGIGPSFSWPIFDAGRIRSAIDAQTAVQEEALITYQNTILQALEEVDNSLTAYANEQIRNNALAEAENSATRAAEVASEQYDAGLISFLDVLDAERTRLSAQDTRAASDATVVSNFITLYKALGGGWETYANLEESPAAESKAAVLPTN